MTAYALRAFGGPVAYNPIPSLTGTPGLSAPVTSGTYTVLIAGQPVFVLAGSLSIDKTIGKRSQAAFTVRTPTTATHFQQYQQVSIFDQTGTLTFSGYITNPKEQKPGFSSTLIHSIQCADQHFLADKRIIAAAYTNKTCGEIVQNIVSTILSQEGVTVGQIFDGVPPSTTLFPSTTLYPGGNVGLVPQATFVYCSVAQALDALVTEASSAGVPYYWQIDENKKLWFVPYTAVVNSTVVDGTKIDQVYNPPSVSRQNPTYRNTQYIIGGVAQTLTQTETRKGDGNTTAFTMGYALSQTPLVTVNGATKTVGVKGIDSGKDWYWAQGDAVITQDTSGTKLVSTDTFQAVYIGQYPTVVLSQNNAQISYEASLDASTGIIEEVETDNTLTSVASGLTKASALLTRYATQGTMLQFTTLAAGFNPGQLITVKLPMFGIPNAQMLIESVNASDQTDGLNIWYTVNAVSGPYDTTWIDFFSTLLQQQQPANSINVGIATTVTLLVTLTAKSTPTATITITVASCPLPSTTLFPNTTLFPC